MEAEIKSIFLSESLFESGRFKFVDDEHICIRFCNNKLSLFNFFNFLLKGSISYTLFCIRKNLYMTIKPLISPEISEGISFKSFSDLRINVRHTKSILIQIHRQQKCKITGVRKIERTTILVCSIRGYRNTNKADHNLTRWR